MNTNGNEARRKRQQAVNAKKTWLVQEGNRIGEIARGSKDWASQGRVMWEAARLENQPAVLLNLLCYQSARKETWNTWRDPDIFHPLKQALEKCIEEASGDTELALDLIRHLLVYTIRAYIYFREEDKRKGKAKSAA